jgi:putative drug exporter of the RND superfamily
VRRLALWVVDHARWVIVGAVVFVVVAAVLGRDAASELSAGGFENPSSESVLIGRQLLGNFPAAGEPDFVVLVTARNGSVDDPQVAAVGKALTQRLARDRAVVWAASYWSLSNAPPLASTNRREALVVGTLRGDLGQRVDTAERLSGSFTTRTPDVVTQVTGLSEVARQVSERSEHDVQRAEIFSMPITAVALVLVFGSVVAAGLPLAIGVIAVVGTLLALHVIASATEVSIFALNLTTGLGLGLAIDYSLFIVSRYREELAAGASARLAVGRTMQTAGRTIVFSAATVMISLLALLLFPFAYVRSFAYAGVAVVGLAALAAVIVLPAVLVLLGPRIEKGHLFTRRRTAEDDDGGFWRRQAERVMRHPWPYTIGVTAFLLLLAVPFLRINLGQIDDRVVPPDVASSRAAADQIRAHFTSRENAALRVSLPGVDPRTDAARIAALAQRLRALDGVARVDAATGFYFADGTDVPAIPSSPLTTRFFSDRAPHSTWLNVVPDIEPISNRGEQLVHDVRDAIAPIPHAGVAGPSARLVDAKSTITGRLPIALGFIAMVTFLLLFLMTGSLLVPLKALLLNVLSLTATFGAIVFVIQDGRFAGVLGYTPTGAIDTFTPLLMFCIAFGLSMDYEVFLISRIKEEYDFDRDNERAVAVGLGKTGHIVTAAALVLTIVFLGLTTSAVVQVKLFGLGLALAVLVDAFLIRATLVPALMRLAGRLNWWAPRFVRRWHLRFGIWENEPIRILDRAFDQR